VSRSFTDADALYLMTEEEVVAAVLRAPSVAKLDPRS
jgi:hypothetical protein